MRLYTLKQISEATEAAPSSVDKRSKKGRKNRKGVQTEAPWVPSGRQGKAALYAFDTLPADIRAALDIQEARAARKAEIAQRQPSTAAVTPATNPEAAKPPTLAKKPPRKVKDEASLDEKDRAARDAALVLMTEIESLQIDHDLKAKPACAKLAQQLLAGECTDVMTQALAATRSKPRKTEQGEAALQRHLERLHGFYIKGLREGDRARYLVPGKREKEGHDPLHVRTFLKFWCHPNRPEVAKVWKEGMVPYLTAQGLKAPSYTTACRIEKGLSVTVKYRGRMTGSARKALLPYISRDVSMFKANDIWVGDGHSFKAKIQSPLHGNAFIPEVTAILDWVSRKVVGYSVALSESTIAVSDAFRDAQLRTHARPLIYYSDNGSGQTGKHIDHEITGTLARQGIAHETGIPGNPQGRGIIERWWPTVLLPLAQTYPTFTGKVADKETVRKMGGELAKAQRAGEISPLLPSFSQFLIDLDAAIARYNNEHQHSALNGMTPNQAYAAKLDPDSIGAVTEEELAQLWMPEEIRTPARGVIQLFNNQYYLPTLVDDLAEGEQVRVRFNIHAAENIQVYRMNGVALGVAVWDGHKHAAFPVAYVEQKREERAEGIKGRAQKNIERADAELTNTYAALPEPAAPEIDLTLRIKEDTKAGVDVELERNRSINRLEDPYLVRHLIAHPEDMNADRARYLLEQADKIRPLERQIEEAGLWAALNKAARSAENFKGVVASTN